MNPPEYGTRVLSAITINEVERFLDREALFAARWQFRQGLEIEAWERFKVERVLPIYERIMAQCRTRLLLVPRIAYGHFRCTKQGNALLVEGPHRKLRFEFPRERSVPHRCLADWFDEGFVTFQIATVGNGIVSAATAAFAEQRYQDAFYFKGAGAAFAEATAAYGHDLIRRELDVLSDQGNRLSPGYPAFPNLFDQRAIDALLSFSRIGVRLTETCHLVPEYSTSAIISTDPRAQPFRP
jgi:5-methyltetrahydrofolate--homocysteine methyltransferase